MFTAPKFSLEGANPGTELIVSARFVDAVSVWEVPVMVTVAGPRAAVLLAVSISTLVPVVGFGVNDAVTPLGRTDVTARFTLPANP
jgi:membrane-associated protease RseP (regulator of RpoE activity)